MEIGGALALTEEAHLLRVAVHRLEMQMFQAAGGEGRKPEPIPLPRPAAELRAEQREHDDLMAAKARRHADRDRRRSPRT